jgi:hypothetical protein
VSGLVGLLPAVGNGCILVPLRSALCFHVNEARHGQGGKTVDSAPTQRQLSGLQFEDHSWDSCPGETLAPETAAFGKAHLSLLGSSVLVLSGVPCLYDLTGPGLSSSPQ